MNVNAQKGALSVSQCQAGDGPPLAGWCQARDKGNKVLTSLSRTQPHHSPQPGGKGEDRELVETIGKKRTDTPYIGMVLIADFFLLKLSL